jgi:hypothetical protein
LSSADIGPWSYGIESSHIWAWRSVAVGAESHRMVWHGMVASNLYLPCVARLPGTRVCASSYMCLFTYLPTVDDTRTEAYFPVYFPFPSFLQLPRD